MRYQARQHEIELGPFGQKLSGEARQESVGKRRECGDAQEAGTPRAQFGCHLGDAVQADEGSLDLGIEGQRLACGHQAGTTALEQRQAQLLLQVADHPAHRGLGDVDQLGGHADATGQHDGPESLDLARIEAAHGIL